MVNTNFSAANLPLSLHVQAVTIAAEIERSGPQYEHDCSDCTFLGRHVHGEKPVDLYFCVPQGEMIARESSEGANYRSIQASMFGPMFGQVSEKTIYHEVARRAHLFGLYAR